MGSASRPVPQFGIVIWMSTLVALALLPVLLFALSLLVQHFERQSAEGEASLARRALRLASAIGQEVEGIGRSLQVLAAAPATRNGDIQALHAHAQRIVAKDERLHSISLSGLDGRQLFTSHRPYGEPLPRSVEYRAQQEVIREGRIQVSWLITGHAGQPVVVVVLPVEIAGVGACALRAAVRPDALAEVLNDAPWPADWTANLLDQRHAIVARSREPERWLGQSADPTLVAGVVGGNRKFVARNKDGQLEQVQVASVPGTDWHVSVGQPVSSLRDQSIASLGAMAAVGMTCLLLSVIASVAVASKLTAQLRRVVEVAGGAGDLPLPATSVREVTEFVRALTALRSHGMRTSAALIDARHDSLTRLPARGLFMEQSAALARQAQAGGGMLALLYVDLDGFKRINDELGHDRGDKVLQLVADTLRAHIRPGDAAGRMGGDEFVVALVGPAGQIEAITLGLAQRIVDSVADLGQGLSCSIGAAFTDIAGGLETAMARADRAMLDAKRAGKNRVVASTEPPHERR